MNDRCVSLLENYEIEVLRTWKGRGAILCETNQGTLILKEYGGRRDKITFQNAVLANIRKQGFSNIETIIANKDGELLTTDQDGTCYVLKTYFEGRECDVKDMQECILAMETLAKMHKATLSEEDFSCPRGSYTVVQEFEKHNKELRRARKFLKEKSQKNDFEIYLMQCYDYFLQNALMIEEEYKIAGNDEKYGESAFICHGDYQHHNIIWCGKDFYIINLEKCVKDSPVRDIYLFMRKLLEKSNWKKETGFMLLDAYEKENRLSRSDYADLYYRLAYPEKFWKIVNFYYNSGKAWIPGKNLEKLIKVNQQEKEKIEFLEIFKEKYDIIGTEGKQATP